jgi:peptidoglycan/LPS O-acetylase OafA/YrhL
MSIDEGSLKKESSEKNSTRLPELDTLRGLAALGVMLFHYTYNQPGINSYFEFRNGVTGVDLFFMISGFVITLSISKIARLRDFIVHRFSRLYPTYWICMLITSLCILVYDPATLSFKNILINMTMVQPYFGVEDLDGSYWTLLVELIFYVWVIFVYILKRVNRIEDAGFITLIVILAYHYFSHLYPEVYAFIQRILPIANYFPFFFSGIIFYHIKFKKATFKRIIFLLVSLISAFYLHDKGGRAMHLISYVQHSVTIVFYHVVFILLVLDKLKFIVKRYFIFLGNISYSLYLLHQYIGRNIIHTLVSYAHLNLYVALLLTILFIILLATGVTYYVEIPIIKYIRDRYKKHGQNEELKRLELQ